MNDACMAKPDSCVAVCASMWSCISGPAHSARATSTHEDVCRLLWSSKIFLFFPYYCKMNFGYFGIIVVDFWLIEAQSWLINVGLCLIETKPVIHFLCGSSGL